MTSVALTKHVKENHDEQLRLETVMKRQKIVFTTKSLTRYTFTMEDPANGVGTLQGGNYFPQPSRVRIMGAVATSESAMIVSGVIQKTMRLKIQGVPNGPRISETNKIITSAILEIYVEG